MTAFLVLIAVFAIAGLWLMTTYNGLVRRRNMVQEAWSGVDVQLKRRANLIPNLVETVRGYMGHEKSVLQEVTSLRTAASGVSEPAERGRLEGLLGQAIGRLFAVAEAYPDLKASETFIGLQRELSAAEDEIQLARRYYNGATRDLNVMIESFPSNLVAGWFSFRQATYFEVEDPADRAVPKVSFG